MNLKEFSKITGIPISTISKALGNYEDVNINTKKRIISLAKKYKYVPNLYAKTLASGVNFSVGLVLPFTYSHEQKITLIDNSHLHKKHKSYDPKRYHIKLIIQSKQLQKLSKMLTNNSV